MISFLLDIVELPEVHSLLLKYKIHNTDNFLQSHTGATMANAFQDMLNRFGLTEKILAVNADNATSNDTQTTKLDQLDNSFEEENRVRCFNHTLQLSAKSLLKPFNMALSGNPADEVDMTDNSNAILEDEEEEGGEEEDAEERGNTEPHDRVLNST